ncbi:MAG: DUF11 domain-containing protein [Acidimicrobiales bacterium]|nr:DUF11 domain-containing protein [Acidimicrobiales bacterium]MCB1015678.1 DUF11 domain-containing protein [Acidimicrobiales bacterium]
MPSTLSRPPAPRAWWALALVALVVAWFVPVALLAGARPAGAEPGPGIANNPWPEDCDLRVGVVVDRSNSIKGASDQNPALVRTAIGDLAERLGGTGASMAVWSFGTLASGYSGPNPFASAPPGSVIVPEDYPSIGFTSLSTPGGVQAVTATVDAIPFTHTHNAPTDPDTRWVAATNWEAGLGHSSHGLPGAVAPNGDRPRDADVVVFFSDGNPTVDNQQLAEGVPHVDVTGAKVEAALGAAEEVKTTGAPTRIVAVGVGDVTVENLERITGGYPAAREFDDYWLTDFGGLGDTFYDVATRICGGSLVLRKLVPGTEPGSWVPRPGWDFEASFPGGAPAFVDPGTDLTTGADGRVELSWLNPSGDTDVTVTEHLAEGQRQASVSCETASGPESGAPAVERGGEATESPWFTVRVPRHAQTVCDVRNYTDGADLRLDKSVAPEVLDGPGDVTFTLTLTNPDLVEPVRIEALYDDHFGDLLDRDNPRVRDNTCDDSEPGSRVMAPGATGSCSFVARVEPAADGGPHVDVVTVHGVELLPTGLEGDAVEVSDDATVSFTTAAGPDLSVTKDDGVETLAPGDRSTYAVTVANHGSVEATGVTLVDVLPAGTTFESASDGGILERGDGDAARDGSAAVVWPWFGLAPGEERTVEVTIAVPGDAVDGAEVLNRVVVDDDGTHGEDPTPEDNADADRDVVADPGVVTPPDDAPPPAGPGPLPRTGGDLAELALWGGALVAGGVALVGLARRAPGGRLRLPVPLRLRRS